MTMDARKTPIRLNNDCKYAIYIYAVENKCIVLGDACTYTFRVLPSKIATEINLLKVVEPTVNAHHVQEAVEMVVSWQKRLQKEPVIPREVVDVERLRAEQIETIKQVETLKLLLAEERKAHAQDAKMKSKFSRIQSIILEV